MNSSGKKHFRAGGRQRAGDGPRENEGNGRGTGRKNGSRDCRLPFPGFIFKTDQLLCLQLEKLPLSAEHALEKVSFC